VNLVVIGLAWLSIFDPTFIFRPEATHRRVALRQEYWSEKLPPLEFESPEITIFTAQEINFRGKEGHKLSNVHSR